MKFNIKPHEGVNSVKFGMTQEDVKKELPDGEYMAVRNTSPEFLTYIYSENQESVFFYFNEYGKLEEVEFSNGIDVSLDNIQLGKLRSASAVLNEVRGYNPNSIGENAWFIKSLNLKIWVEHPEDDEIGSILIGK